MSSPSSRNTLKTIILFFHQDRVSGDVDQYSEDEECFLNEQDSQATLHKFYEVIITDNSPFQHVVYEHPHAE